MSTTVPQPLSYEQMMEMFHQTHQQMKETDLKIQEVAKLSKETDLKIQEVTKLSKETDLKIQEVTKLSKETDLKIQEVTKLSKETDQRMKETDRQMKETDLRMKETDRQMKETNKKIEALGSRIGELIETMVESGIIEHFQSLNYEFTQYSRHFEFRNKELGIAGEIDFLLENGDFVCAVEVKTNASVSDVKEHLLRLEKYRRYLDAKGKKEKIIGAVGGGVIRENVKQLAMKSGLFVIIQSGDSIKVLPPKERKAKEW